MKDRLLAVLNLAVALFLYPLAFAALVWIGWTGRSVLWALLIVGIILWLDRGWMRIVTYWINRFRQR